MRRRDGRGEQALVSADSGRGTVDPDDADVHVGWLLSCRITQSVCLCTCGRDMKKRT